MGGISSSNKFSGKIFSLTDRFPLIRIIIWSLRKYVANAIPKNESRKFFNYDIEQCI